MFSGDFVEVKGDKEPLVDLASCRYCNICGCAIFPDKLEQHANYHLTTQRILDELAKVLFEDKAGYASNIWLDLDNLRNGELT